MSMSRPAGVDSESSQTLWFMVNALNAVGTKADGLPQKPANGRPGATGGRFGLVFMLVSASLIVYIDRGSLSIAAPELANQLSLSPAQIGVLLSAFSWTYVSVMVAAGWAVDNYNPARVLAIGLFIWSLATFSTGFASTLGVLLIFRLLLGLGESFAYPTVYTIIGRTFPAHQRAVRNALVDAGARVGAGLSTLLGGLFIARFGWRNLFLFLGVASMLWLLPWLLLSPRLGEHVSAPPKQQDSPTLGEILRNRSAWGMFLGMFCSSYAYYFLLTWLPYYLVSERHLSIGRTALWGSFPFVAAAAASLSGGWTSDHWVRHGASETLARKSFLMVGCLGCIVILPAYLVSNLAASIALLSLAYLAIGLWASNVWAATQALAGPAMGRWSAWQGAIGNVAGIVAPLVSGLIVSATGNLFWAFLSGSVIGAAGTLFYMLMVGEIAPVVWAAGNRT
jgi:MFS family permease